MLETNSLPRPSIPFAILSALIIGGVLFCLSGFVAGCVVEANFFVFLGLPHAFAISILLSVQQYRGTFRAVPAAATTTSVLFYVIAGLSLLAGIATTGEAVLGGVSLGEMAPLLGSMLIAAVLSAALGLMNALWARKLRAALAAGAVSPPERGFSLRELLLGVGVIAGPYGPDHLFAGGYRLQVLIVVSKFHEMAAFHRP